MWERSVESRVLVEVAPAVWVSVTDVQAIEPGHRGALVHLSGGQTVVARDKMAKSVLEALRRADTKEA